MLSSLAPLRAAVRDRSMLVFPLSEPLWKGGVAQHVHGAAAWRMLGGATMARAPPGTASGSML